MNLNADISWQEWPIELKSGFTPVIGWILFVGVRARVRACACVCGVP